jgi:2-oxoglutarate dehydrogenase E2 component (dihydrolipoamide succinyltransferase)
MATEIKMPQLGESVTEGTIGKWLKHPGERVEKYEALLEVTTDKVDTEVPAPESGILREIAVPEGTTVRVGTLLAVLDSDGEGAQSVVRGSHNEGERASNGKDQRSNVQTAPPELASPALRPAPLRPFDYAQGRQAQEPEPRSRRGEGFARSNAFVSPVVARLASEHQIDLGRIEGTGQGGRITKQDVLKYIEMRKAEPEATTDAKTTGEITSEAPTRPLHEPALLQEAEPPTLAPPMPTTAAHAAPAAFEIPDDAEIVPITPMRRTIAEHMVRSRRTAPHVTSVFELDVSRIVAHRQRRKAEFERQGVKLTYTAYFVQAAVAALQAVPIVNGSYSDNGVVLNRRINIGVAVALEEGLIVPVLRDADEKNLLGLARGLNDLAERARTRRLKPDETQGGTFTITNHGVSGSLFATPIINQPQAAILGIGAIQKRAVVVTQDDVDAIAIRPMCYVSLTIDHRLLDGATADKFLSVLKEFVEGYAE